MHPIQIFQSYEKQLTSKPEDYNYCPSCGTELDKISSSSERQRCNDCGWIRYLNPLPGVVVLITEEDRILLGKRGKSSFAADKWCIPGGFIEHEEDFLTAGIREVYEETGLKIKVESILSVVSNFLSQDLHTLVIVLHAKIIEGVPEPRDDLYDLEWFSFKAPLPEMAFEADKHIIKRFFLTEPQGAPVDPNFSS